MKSQFAVLSELKGGLDATNARLAATNNALMGMQVRLAAMAQSLRKTSETTASMTQALRNLPKQGALGIAVLVAELIVR